MQPSILGNNMMMNMMMESMMDDIMLYGAFLYCSSGHFPSFHSLCS